MVALALDDLLAHRQADAGAGIFVAPGQALEDDEGALELLRLDADAFIAHRKVPFGCREMIVTETLVR